MPRFLMKLMYDGTAFHGWQFQPGQRTVQNELEKALRHFGANPALVIASGRTDAGVHALEQYAHFDYAGSMNEEQLVLAFRSLLDEDVRVLRVWRVADDFHARFLACERCYKYLLAKGKNPFNRLYMGFLAHYRLDVDTMQELAPLLIGCHDFSSFSKDNPAVPNHVCTLKELTIQDRSDYLEFWFRADRFLHHMVRRIVGTLVNFSHLELPAEELQRILEDRNARQTLVITAPPQGLYLCGVKYPDPALDDYCP